MWATCHTEGCSNAGYPVDVGDITYQDNDGNTLTMQTFCGVCNNEITDFTAEQPPMPDPEDEMEGEDDMEGGS